MVHRSHLQLHIVLGSSELLGVLNYCSIEALCYNIVINRIRSVLQIGTEVAPHDTEPAGCLKKHPFSFGKNLLVNKPINC